MRRLNRLSMWLVASDLVVTSASLYVSSLLRSSLPFGAGGALRPASTLVPWQVYLFAALCWPLALAYTGAYDPQRVLRWYNEALHIVFGGGAAFVLMAGMLYMSFRELSRLQFIYFFLVNITFMLGYRALIRIYYRTMGRRRPGGRSRTLRA